MTLTNQELIAMYEDVGVNPSTAMQLLNSLSGLPRNQQIYMALNDYELVNAMADQDIDPNWFAQNLVTQQEAEFPQINIIKPTQSFNITQVLSEPIVILSLLIITLLIIIGIFF